MNRREFIGSAAITGALGALSGCTGGSSESNGTNGNENTSSGNGAETSTTGSVSIFTTGLKYDGRKIYTPINSKANVDKIQLNSPNGQKWNTYNMQRSETSAEFTLIKKSPTGFESYPFGTWKLYALRGGNQVGSADVRIRPKLTIADVQNGEYGTLSLKFKNVGSGPAVVSRARVSKKGASIPDDQGWALGSLDYSPEPIAPTETATVPAQAEGFDDAYAPSNDETATGRSSRQVCSGETKQAVVDYKLFTSDESITTGPTITMKLSGGRESVDTDGINCAKVTLQSGGRSTSATSSTSS